MELQQIYPAERIKVGLESTDKDELFEELTEVLVMQGCLPLGRAAILEALWRREGQMSTGIARGLALPHAQIPGIEGSYGVIGISSQGIDYDALDHQRVHLVFLLISSEHDSERHLGVLDRLAILFQDPDFLVAMLAAPDAVTAFHILQKFWSILAPRAGR
jgi:PTS system fructose-specific IIC component/PTS system nitrogen regulatory IIA component